MLAMKPYSEDLRKKIGKKIVAALERGMPKTEAARTFGVSLSSVKRYWRFAAHEESLAPRKGGGRPPKANAAVARLLKEDVAAPLYAAAHERVAFLRGASGVGLSASTVRRLLRRLGFSQKTEPGCVRTRRVLEMCLEGRGLGEARGRAPRVRGRDGHQHLALSTLRLVEGGRAPAGRGPEELGQENVTLLSSMSIEGMGPSVAVEGASTRAAFEAYVEQALAPSLSPGRVVVMNSLSAHKRGRIGEIIEEGGCELRYLPPYSPELNPIEEAFAKVKGLMRRAQARTREALIGAMGKALSAVSARDARGFFEHSGYRAMGQPF
jgi:transposase